MADGSHRFNFPPPLCALAEANRILLDVHDSYEDSRAAGESLQRFDAFVRAQARFADRRREDVDAPVVRFTVDGKRSAVLAAVSVGVIGPAAIRG